jgi:hypothetical protein
MTAQVIEAANMDRGGLQEDKTLDQNLEPSEEMACTDSW